jgi:hypothetical protein
MECGTAVREETVAIPLRDLAMLFKRVTIVWIEFTVSPYLQVATSLSADVGRSGEVG